MLIFCLLIVFVVGGVIWVWTLPDPPVYKKAPYSPPSDSGGSNLWWM